MSYIGVYRVGTFMWKVFVVLCACSYLIVSASYQVNEDALQLGFTCVVMLCVTGLYSPVGMIPMELCLQLRK